jgi:hypothetical protein
VHAETSERAVCFAFAREPAEVMLTPPAPTAGPPDGAAARRPASASPAGRPSPPAPDAPGRAPARPGAAAVVVYAVGLAIEWYLSTLTVGTSVWITVLVACATTAVMLTVSTVVVMKSEMIIRFASQLASGPD